MDLNQQIRKGAWLKHAELYQQGPQGYSGPPGAEANPYLHAMTPSHGPGFTPPEPQEPERPERSISAPVTPGELGTAAVENVGIPWGISRVLSGPTSVAGVAKSMFGPAALPFNSAFDVIGAATGPLSDPMYQSGQRGYLASIGPSFNRKLDELGDAQRETEQKYGVLGTPIQALHGLMNPLTSASYLVRGVGQNVMDKFGSLGLEAEERIRASLRG